METKDSSFLFKEITPNPIIRVDLHLAETELTIGKTGPSYRYIPIKQKNQRDYTFERKKAVQVLVENQGTTLGPDDLWRSIYEDESDCDPRILARVHSWLTKIEYKDHYIFRIQRVKRGEVECFASSKFDISLSEPSGESIVSASEDALSLLGKVSTRTLVVK